MGYRSLFGWEITPEIRRVGVVEAIARAITCALEPLYRLGEVNKRPRGFSYRGNSNSSTRKGDQNKAPDFPRCWRRDAYECVFTTTGTQRATLHVSIQLSGIFGIFDNFRAFYEYLFSLL